MKNLKSISLIFVAALSLTSCMQSSWIQKTAKSTDVKESMITHVPVIADLKVNPEKVTGTYSSSNPQHNIDFVKDMAIAEAVSPGNYDLLIEPTFEVRITGADKTAIVKGYPAKYTNFRNFVASDTVWMKLNKSKLVNPVGLTENTTVTKTKSSSTPDPKQNSKAAGAGAAAGSLILLTLIITLVALAIG